MPNTILVRNASGDIVEIPTIGALLDIVSTSALQGAGNASLAAITNLLAALGEVQASPTADTVLDRLKTIAELLPEALGAGGSLSVIINDAEGAPLDLGGVAEVTGSRTDPNRPRLFSNSGVLTRPPNATPYSVNDAIDDSGTAGSCTAHSIELSDTNDDPVEIVGGILKTTDTGPAAAQANVEVFIFNSDPTANSGVGDGDNATFSNKMAGFVCRLVGTFKPAAGYFSDGSVCELSVANDRAITPPATGTKVVYWRLKTLTAFTPSANSTSFTFTPVGRQGRA